MRLAAPSLHHNIVYKLATKNFPTWSKRLKYQVIGHYTIVQLK